MADAVVAPLEVVAMVLKPTWGGARKGSAMLRATNTKGETMTTYRVEDIESGATDDR